MPTLVSENATLERELWTAEDFLDWLKPGVHADLIDGEKFMHSPVSLVHADLLNFVDRLLGAYIEQHNLGKLYHEVVAVRLSSRNVFCRIWPLFRASFWASCCRRISRLRRRWLLKRCRDLRRIAIRGRNSPPTRSMVYRSTGFSIPRRSHTASIGGKARSNGVCARRDRHRFTNRPGILPAPGVARPESPSSRRGLFA